MSELKVKQLKCETDTCKQVLDLMTEENIRAKDRLSEILKDRFDKNLLEEVDGFQGNFIKTDELIKLIRNDISELSDLITKEDPGKLTMEMDKKLKRLRHNMKLTENRFANTKSAFNTFLIENIL